MAELTTAELTTDRRTLFSIAEDLAAYVDSLDCCETDEERADCEASIAAICRELADKGEAVVAVRKRMAAERELAKSIRDDAARRMKALDRAEERLDNYVIAVMERNGMSRMPAGINSISLRLTERTVIDDPAAVPVDYKAATVKIPLRIWRAISEAVSGNLALSSFVDSAVVTADIPLTPIKTLLKAGCGVPGARMVESKTLVVR